MTYRERFENLRRINKDIEEELQEIFRLKELATSTTIDYEKDNVQSSGDKDLVGKIVGMIVDREAKVDELIDGLVDEKKALTIVLRSIQNPIFRDILYLYYFYNMSRKQIAIELQGNYIDNNIDVDKVRVYHNRALNILDVVEKNEKDTKCCG